MQPSDLVLHLSNPEIGDDKTWGLITELKKLAVLP